MTRGEWLELFPMLPKEVREGLWLTGAVVVGALGFSALAGLILTLWLAMTDPCGNMYLTFTPIGAEVVRRDCDGRCFLARGGKTFLVQCPKVSP
jgi:hypothetical protein